jgi:hypothetical protein
MKHKRLFFAAPAGPMPSTPEPKKVIDVPTVCGYEDMSEFRRLQRLRGS